MKQHKIWMIVFAVIAAAAALILGLSFWSVRSERTTWSLVYIPKHWTVPKISGHH